MANLSISRRGEPYDPTLSRLRDPFRIMDPLRMIRDIMGTDVFGGLVQPTSEVFAPDIEMKESKDAFIMTADLPGVKMDDVDVNVTGNRLTVSGKREEEERDENDRYFAYERSYGAFSRSFMLPEGADIENIHADFNDGVLKIRVPKRAEVKGRRIPLGHHNGEKQPELKKAA